MKIDIKAAVIYATKLALFAAAASTAQTFAKRYWFDGIYIETAEVIYLAARVFLIFLPTGLISLLIASQKYRISAATLNAKKTPRTARRVSSPTAGNFAGIAGRKAAGFGVRPGE